MIEVNDEHKANLRMDIWQSSFDELNQLAEIILFHNVVHINNVRVLSFSLNQLHS